jgi:hypothetical protein
MLLVAQLGVIFFSPGAIRTVSPFDFAANTLDHKREFRFHADEIALIASALLPLDVVSDARCSAPRVLALSVVLRVLAFPCRQDRMAQFFQRSSSWVSQIFHSTLEILYSKALRVLRSFSPTLVARIPAMAQVVLNQFGFNFWGLLDGTKFLIPRPSIEQRMFYNGYEGCHVLRMLALVRVDGLMELALGVYAGATGDLGIYSVENLEMRLDALHDSVLAVAGNGALPRPYILSVRSLSLLVCSLFMG